MLTRLESIQIENMKNVKNGRIDFYHKAEPLNIVGIYGANGSGKTTFVDAISLLRYVLTAQFSEVESQQNMLDLVSQKCLAKISITAINNQAEVNYKVSFSKVAVADSKRHFKLQIEEEVIRFKARKKGARMRTLLHYKRGTNFSPLLPIPLKELTKVTQNRLKSQNNLVQVLVLSSLVAKNGGSFLWNDDSAEILETGNILPQELSKLKQWLQVLAANIVIYSSKISGQIYSDITMPLSFNVDNFYGLISIPIDETRNIPPNVFKIGQQVFKQINRVLPDLIPGLTIALNKKDTLKNKNNEEVYTAEVMATRDDNTFPLRCESDGIKKIISILSTLMNVYGNPQAVAVIDELDAGIYEYLLGEIVAVLSDNARGLLIFTSHNLRPLEVLDYKKIIFTTTNPDNRYLTIRNIKPSNNLRDTYLRLIQLGGSEEELFKNVNETRINRAFRQANKLKKEFDRM